MGDRHGAGPFDRNAFRDRLRASPELSDAAVRLALQLDGYADHDGTCWPSQRRLAADLGWSPGKVSRIMAEVDAAGLARYRTRAIMAGQRSLIELDPDRRSTGGADCSASRADRSTGGIDRSTGGIDRSTGDVRNSSKNSSKNPPAHAGASANGRGPHPSDEGGASENGRGEPWRPLWAGAVDQLPDRVRRRIDGDRAGASLLRAALAAAAAAGITGGAIRALWDEPTALDADDVDSPARVLAARIRSELAP
jgi:hypothetical protein